MPALLRNFAVNKSFCLSSQTQWDEKVSDGVFLREFYMHLCHKKSIDEYDQDNS